MPFATRQARRIHFASLGGGPAVLLVAGLGSGAQLFGTLPRRFQRSGIRCLTMDPVGVPPSSALPEAFTFEDAALDLLAVLDEAGLERCTLVGTSLGGKVALTAAHHAPERVAALVMLACAAVVTARARRVHRFFEIVSHLPPDEIGQAVAPFLFGSTFLATHPGLVDDIVRAMRFDAAACAFMRSQAQALQDFDGTRLAQGFPHAALCIAGAEDTLTTTQEVRDTAALFAHGRYVEIADAGHSLLLESPAVYDHVLALLEPSS